MTDLMAIPEFEKLESAWSCLAGGRPPREGEPPSWHSARRRSGAVAVFYSPYGGEGLWGLDVGALNEAWEDAVLRSARPVLEGFSEGEIRLKAAAIPDLPDPEGLEEALARYAWYYGKPPGGSESRRSRAVF